MTDEPTPTGTGGGRRRVAERRRRLPSSLTVLGVVIPLLTVAALALVRPAVDPTATHAPQQAVLDRTTLVCPARLPGADDVRMGASAVPAGDAGSGDLSLRVGRDEVQQEIGGGVATRSERPLVVVDGRDDLAPGLVASRFGSGSATRCGSPVPERWFTGAGASAEHASTLTLVNPDKGPAVADVTVWDGSGVVDAPALRGIRVPGGRSTSFDLAEVVPNRDALALRVVVSRGRLGASVVDVVDPVGRDRPVREWLPAQAAPAETSYVLGVGEAGSRTLTVANPGEDEVRVDLRLVSSESEFAVEGLDELRIPAGTVTEVDLGRVLRGRTAQGVRALRVDATGPVTASLRIRSASDLALAAAGPTVESEAAVALPTGAKRLLVADADAPGVVLVRAWDEDGQVAVRERRVEIDPATAVRIQLPDDAALAVVELDRTTAVVSLESTDGGLSLLPLEQLERTSWIADVRPAQR